MRSFFKSELETLKAKTGLNQYENFSAMTDAQGKNVGAKQIGILLDSMVLACNEFPYIPDMDKCSIIQKMIIQDQDFTALNSRSVWKWLNMHKDVYWGKVKHEEENLVDHPPLTEEEKKALDEELERRRLAAFGITPRFDRLDLTMKAIESEDKERSVEKKGTSTGRTAFIVKRDNHLIENVLAVSQEQAEIIVDKLISDGTIVI